MLSKTYRLEREQFIPRSRDEVFAFFADASNLEAITPDFLNFRIVTPQPIVLQPGTLIDYRIKLFGVPLKWRTRIAEFEPPHRFVDTQLRGPYALWHHTHEFREVAGGTQMTDRVDYRIRFGPLGRVARWLWVGRTLERIFDHRAETIGRLLAQDAR